MTVTTHTDVVTEQEWNQLRRHLDLSPRQADIVRHLLYAESDKQIARELRISLPTVRSHMGRLFHKFNLSDRVELLIHVFVCLRQCWRDGDEHQSEPDN